MASSNLCIPSCIEIKSGDDGIMCATFDYEAKLHLSGTDEVISDNLVSLDSKNLNISQVGSPTSVPQENYLENKLDNNINDLSFGLNKTFDARQKKSDSNEVPGVILDKTINLLSMKPINLSLHLDSDESLGIISDVLDENNTLDLLVPFKSLEKSSVQFMKKSNTNLLAFSPLHLRNSNGVYLEDNDSPMICRFTSTPEPPCSKQQMKNLEMKQDFPSEEGVKELDLIDPEKCYEDFKKGNIITSTSKKTLLKDCLNIFEATTILPNDLHTESNKVQLRNSLETNQGEIKEFIDPEKCYEDFKKGNVNPSTSKVSLLKDCPNILETTTILPNDLHTESNKVQLGKNTTLEINNADQSSLLLNATFDVKSEPLKEALPISELQTDTVPVSFEDIPKNDTYTFDCINNTPEEKDNKVINTTFTDLPEKKEPNPSNLMETLSSCLPISRMDESKQREHNSCIKSKKSNFEAKRPVFKRSIAMPKQKLNPSKIDNHLNSEFNSTFCMENSKPSNNDPAKLDRRCSLGSSFGISRHSNIGLMKTHSQPKSNGVCNSKYIGYKLPEIKASNTSTGSAKRIPLGKCAVSPIKQNNLINKQQLSKTTVKPKVYSQIKHPNSEGKVPLDNTFTKDEKINFALSPIIEKNKTIESIEEILDLPHVEKNRTLILSEIDVESRKVPKCTHIEENKTFESIKEILDLSHEEKNRTFSPSKMDVENRKIPKCTHIEKENKTTESMEEILDLPHVEKNRTISLSEIDVENGKVPKYTHIEENKTTEPIEKILDLPHEEKNRTFSPSKIDVENMKIPKCAHSGNPNTWTPIENENRKNSTSSQCVEKPAVLTKRFHKVDATNIPLPMKPKQSSTNKLVSTSKTNKNAVLKSQNINLNGKYNLSQTIKNPQFSRLPTFGSTFSKKLMPNTPKVPRMVPIDSSRVLPNQCSSTRNSKPVVQSVRMLRAPEISIPKGNKLKAPSVFGNKVSSCLEKGS